MSATALSAAGIALRGAPDFDIASTDARNPPVQAMQLDITQDVVDELLESVRAGKVPQIFFGRTPQLKYGDKTHALQTNPESYRYELYQSSGTGSSDDDDEDDDHLEFAGLINHSLAVQKAEDVTAGVDTALEQLKHSMAAISEFKEANKTIVGNTTPMRTPGHRRLPSKGFKPQHLNSSTAASPLLSVPSSPMRKAPTSQPSGNHDLILRALRVPLIHLLAIQPSREAYLAETCRTTLATVRDILPKIARRSQDDQEKWQLTDKSFADINPWKFPYKSAEDRQQAINSAVKSFDRMRLAKDDKLWQILLPVEERGQQKCLSRLNLKAPEPKTNAKPSTPLHKMTKQGDKKPAAAKKAESKDPERRAEKKVKETKPVAEPRAKKVAKEKAQPLAPSPAVKEVRDAPKPANARTPLTSASTSTSTSTPSASASISASTSKPAATATAPPNRNTPAADSNKIRTKKMAPAADTASPRVKPKAPARDPPPRERTYKPPKPAMPLNTKPKNPSPLSASPPVNASDFEDNHPVHKVLSGSPVKPSSGNSDRTLKRKANDIDSDIHNHSLAVKQPRVNRPAPNHTPSSSNGRTNGGTPSSAGSLKRRSDDSSASNTPAKIRKVANIDTGLAARYPNHSSQPSPGDSSSSNTSPSLPSLSFRQTVELSQKFQRYYKKYETLYWKLAESDSPPAEGQRAELLNMHKKLEEMKREIKAGAGVKR